MPLGDFRPGRSDIDGVVVTVEPLRVMLGVPRLHALLATGNIISKTAAGEHALIAFPRWSALLHRCLDHRAGRPETFTVADAKPAIPYGRTVITTALAL